MDMAFKARHKLDDIPSALKSVGSSGSATTDVLGTEASLAITREGRETLSGRSNEESFSLASDSKSESGSSTNLGAFASDVRDPSDDEPEDSEGPILLDLDGWGSLAGLPSLKASLRFVAISYHKWKLNLLFRHVRLSAPSSDRTMPGSLYSRRQGAFKSR